MTERKRYVLAGAGMRGLEMFGRPLLATYTKYCELVGLFDRDPLRMRGANELLGTSLPAYTDFDDMIQTANPDVVIVATMDATHAGYIVRTLEAGIRVISEKPVCTTAQQMRKILDASRSSDALGLVTHNMRYGTAIGKMKGLIDDGAIGEILTIDFRENLDRCHGADYFRRWHRNKANSGGLLVHKSCHHFDVLSWIVGSKPDTVIAWGDLLFYGGNGPYRSERCTGCPHASRCAFYVDLWMEEPYRRLYRDAESAGGYVRDRCVFSEDIDIEDHAAVLYEYENGVGVVYRLTAFATYEGIEIQIEGTEGRLEYSSVHSPGVPGNRVMEGIDRLESEQLELYSFDSGFQSIPIRRTEGDHGGADTQLRDEFFGRPFDAPATERQASLWEAGQAVLIGDAANISIAHGSQVVDVQSLLEG